MTFGVLAPLSGKESARGRDLADGANMAGRDLNARGGVIGRDVKIITKDDECTRAGAQAAVAALASEHAAGIAGTVCDDAARGAVEVARQSGLPLLISGAHADDLVGPDTATAYLMDSTPYQAALATVHWLSYLGAQRLAVVSDSVAAADAHADRVGSLATPIPLLVSRQRWVEPGDDADGRLSTIVEVALKARPDVVYWSGDAGRGGTLLAALRSRGYSGRFVASAEAEQDGFHAAAPAPGESVFTVVPASPTNLPAAQDWARRFEKLYDRAPTRDAMLAYDAVRALGQAVTQTGTVDAGLNSAQLPRLDDAFSTFMGPLAFAPDHTLKYGTNVVLGLSGGSWTLANTLRSHYDPSSESTEP